MNTNLLKKFAQQARTKLIKEVAARLDYVLHTDTAELREKTKALRQLQEAINATNQAQVIDKVAYTWFNRLMALRYMDANDYQPIGIRVLTPKDGYTLPEILEEAKHGHISEELHVNRNHIFELLDGIRPSANPQNEAYKALLIGACNQLSRIFPFLFERIDDYTELLMPDDLISQYSVIQDVRDGMATEDCQEVEIIGWLYQFYISEKKDEVFASKSAVKKEDIPAATQLFTPRWIVEYMVQNTVGKLWLQNRPNSRIKQHMPYYIESATAAATDYLKLNSIEELRLLDQASGSGHILVYGFDLLYKIYEEEGYNPSDIPQLIIEKNLYGFEIDERASQLAGMALMMKARSVHRRFFRKEVQPNILCYADLKLSESEVTETFAELGINLPESLKQDLNLMRQATNLGSLIQPKTAVEVLKNTLAQLETQLLTANIFTQPNIEAIQNAISQLIPLGEKYHCVVDNPPYMGGGNMNKELGDFVKTNYADSKADLMACFMEVGLSALHQNGFLGMINQHSWMFLSSYEKLRTKLIDSVQFDTLLHLGPRTFPEIGGEVVQNASFTFWNFLAKREGSFIRLVDFENSELKRDKTLEAIRNNQCGWLYTANQKDFEKIPGSPIGYWLSEKMFKLFGDKYVGDYMDFKKGMSTGDNLRFIRQWVEVANDNSNFDCKNSDQCISSNMKWFPINSGGEFRKWYGNNMNLANWYNSGLEMKTNAIKLNNGGHWSRYIVNTDVFFIDGLSWNAISSSSFGARLFNNGFMFSSASMCGFGENKIEILGLLNSKLSSTLLNVLSPTLNFGAQQISKLPITELSNNYIKSVTENNIYISKIDWDSRETSWDFQQNELIRCKSNCGQNCADLDMLSDEDRDEILAMTNVPTNSNLLEECYHAYKSEWRRNFFHLHQNEEELNRQFIEIYGLQDELTPDVPLEDITILKEETTIENRELVFHADEVMEQFVSYSVGCMFGRYSLDMPGLILANQGETLADYFTKVFNQQSLPDWAQEAFLPDADNIIPILDEEWFEDDIVTRFNAFLKASFGKENFDKNLAFVEESLGMDVRKYFTKSFYADHIKRYKKRPIYWMFSSPKGSFNVLIYMHRYTPDTLNQILNKYLREYKEKISAHMEHLDHIIESGSSAEATKATKQKDKYKLVLLELQEYERDILYPLATERIAIDLDDGVLVNYNKFGKAIKEVAGLNDKKTKEKVKEFDWIDGEGIR
jgi:type II restriction/modification system DNA methylase subunit YeeA